MLIGRRALAKLLLKSGVGMAAFPTLAKGLLAQASQASASRSGPRFSCMLWTLEKQASFDRCLEIVAKAGYQGVELVGEFHHWDVAETQRIVALLRTLDLVVDAMSGVDAGFAVPAQTEAFLAQFATHLQSMRTLGCSRAILLSGPRVEGMQPEAQRATAVANLQRAADLAASAGGEILIEPIDSLENPKIFLQSVTEAFTIVRAVQRPNVRVLYDLYHEQRGFGNLLEKLENNLDLVGLIHVADVPGRHEPGTGEIDYGTIYRKLAEMHYDRWIAMEFYPTREPVQALRDARLEAEAAFHAERTA